MTHPETGLSERPDFLEVYDQYLTAIRQNRDIWFTTAGELCRYWLAGREAGTGDRIVEGALPHSVAGKAS